MIKDISEFQRVFFIGVAGVGMSAIAQYLKGIGKDVAGSDRYFIDGQANRIREQLEAEGIQCFSQGGSGLNKETDLVVVSTAIEDSVPEVRAAKDFNIPIIKRSEVLALIANSKRTIAVAGTSGKSSTSGMLFAILNKAGYEPSIISGAGLTSLIEKGKIGNAFVGNGDWLIIEADESDGSIVNYKPEIGLLLNIDKDHQEIAELKELFTIFKNNTEGRFIVNRSNSLASEFSANPAYDFGLENSDAKYRVDEFYQDGLSIEFQILSQAFSMDAIGMHSAENAAGAVAVANSIGIDLKVCSQSLANYKGIYRRHQILGKKNDVWIIDDYAHNPAKCAASIRACQPLAKKVIAWFQPHGYGPTRFLQDEFVKEITNALRDTDEIWMSEIYYAGGTAKKDISSNDLISQIERNGKKAFFVEDRDDFLEKVRPSLDKDSVLLLMGARDPSLEEFSKNLFNQF